jgi:hypothetical protein
MLWILSPAAQRRSLKSSFGSSNPPSHRVGLVLVFFVVGRQRTAVRRAGGQIEVFVTGIPGPSNSCGRSRSDRAVALGVREPWRIRKSSQKRSGVGSLVSYRHRATVRIHDSPAHTRCPPVGHHCQTHAPGRSTCSRGRIRDDKAPVAHHQPRAAAGAEPEFVRSPSPGSWVTVRAGKPNP